MKRSNFLYRRSPNVVSVGDRGLTYSGRRFTVVAVGPMLVDVAIAGGWRAEYFYPEAARLLSA